MVRLGGSGPSLAGIRVVRHTAGDSVGNAGPVQVPVDNTSSPPAVFGTGPREPTSPWLPEYNEDNSERRSNEVSGLGFYL